MLAINSTISFVNHSNLVSFAEIKFRKKTHLPFMGCNRK